MTCEWTQDTDIIIMEVPQNRTSQDSEPSSIRQMMIEMEQAGLVDVTLNGHKCERCGGVAGDLTPILTESKSSILHCKP